MSNTDAVMAQLAELTAAVREKGASAKTELQWDTISKEFGAQIEALVAAQVAEKLASQPVRPGTAMAANAVYADSGLAGTRYAPMLRSFAQGQAHNWGIQRVQPVDLFIAKAILDTQAKHFSPAQGGTLEPASDDLNAAIKALTSTGSATGDELVPTGMAAALWQDFFLASRVVASMMRVDMPTNPFDVPLGLGAVTWRKGTENTATTVSDPATAKSVLTATELVTEQNWSYTLNEDAVVAMAPAVRQRLAQSGAEIMDDFALNADATDAASGNINLVDADPDADAYYLSAGQDGIRHQWLVDNTSQTVAAGGDALADADVTGMLTKMGKYAADPSQLVIVCDPGTYFNGFLKLTEVVGIDKFGPNTPTLTGQLGSYRGFPIVVSASHRLQNSAGKVPAAGGTLGSVSAFNRNMWYAGFRRDLLIEGDRDVQKRQYILVTSLRIAVASHGARASATHTAGIANILV